MVDRTCCCAIDLDVLLGDREVQLLGFRQDGLHDDLLVAVLSGGLRLVHDGVAQVRRLHFDRDQLVGDAIRPRAGADADQTPELPFSALTRLRHMMTSALRVRVTVHSIHLKRLRRPRGCCDRASLRRRGGARGVSHASTRKTRAPSARVRRCAPAARRPSCGCRCESSRLSPMTK